MLLRAYGRYAHGGTRPQRPERPAPYLGGGQARGSCRAARTGWPPPRGKVRSGSIWAMQCRQARASGLLTALPVSGTCGKKKPLQLGPTLRSQMRPPQPLTPIVFVGSLTGKRR